MARHNDEPDLRELLERADRLLRIAYENCEDTIFELNAFKKEKLEKMDLPEPEFRRTVSSVTKAIETMFRERDRLDEFRKKCDADVSKSGLGLDLDALRTEIRRRLDLLRDAR